MTHDLVRAVRFRLEEAARDAPDTCPITNPVPKGRRVHRVPVRFQGAIGGIILERREQNKLRTDPALSRQYYHIKSAIEDSYDRIIDEIRRQYTLPKRAIIELHSGWMLSITTLTEERKRFREKKKLEKVKRPAE